MLNLLQENKSVELLVELFDERILRKLFRYNRINCVSITCFNFYNLFFLKS